MTVGPADYLGGALWSMDAVPYHALAREPVYEDALLFYILASASPAPAPHCESRTWARWRRSQILAPARMSVCPRCR